MKKKLFVIDLVILEEYCNGNCDYCLTKDSSIRDEHLEIVRSGFCHPDANDLFYYPGTKLYIRLNNLLDTIKKYIDAPIIKVSGGEIFLIPGIVDFIYKLSSEFFRVQILTNGTLLNLEIVEKIASMKNVHVQVSLDGWSAISNEARIHNNVSMQEKIINNIMLLSKYNIPVEINCVLHNRNIPYILETVSEVSKIKSDIKYIPYPVRGSSSRKYQIRTEQLEFLDNLIQSYNDFERVLPPYEYLKELRVFYTNSMKRKGKCVLKDYMCQLFDDGLLVACVNMWTLKIGNIMDCTGSDLINQIGVGRISTLLGASKPSLYCRGCFTPWDIINLYFTKTITLNQLTEIPLYRGLESFIVNLPT